MKAGARNKIKARVKFIKEGDVMSLIKFEVISADEMASVITTESMQEMNIQIGDEVQLDIKAVHVLPVKE